LTPRPAILRAVAVEQLPGEPGLVQVNVGWEKDFVRRRCGLGIRKSHPVGSIVPALRKNREERGTHFGWRYRQNQKPKPPEGAEVAHSSYNESGSSLEICAEYRRGEETLEAGMPPVKDRP